MTQIDERKITFNVNEVSDLVKLIDFAVKAHGLAVSAQAEYFVNKFTNAFNETPAPTTSPEVPPMPVRHTSAPVILDQEA